MHALPLRLTFFLAGCLVVCTEAMTLVQTTVAADVPQRLPNILWITGEDHGPQLGCYGDKYADTPNIDRLAAKGMRYTRCWSNAPVCAPARTTIISGLFPNSTGSQHMRCMTALPAGFQLYPELLKAQGYYCTNHTKEDYNVEKPKDLWNGSNNKAHYRNRGKLADGSPQPFFAVINFTTTHESQIRTRPHKAVHDPAKFTVPPFHPDLPEVRQDWAQYYDRITEFDQQLGEVLSDLERMDWPKTRSCSTTVIMAPACRAANAGYTRRDCWCRWLFMSPKGIGHGPATTIDRQV